MQEVRSKFYHFMHVQVAIPLMVKKLTYNVPTLQHTGGPHIKFIPTPLSFICVKFTDWTRSRSGGLRTCIIANP